MSSGKGLTHVKTTLLPGQERVTVVASLPTNLICDVTANIPIKQKKIVFFSYSRGGGGRGLPEKIFKKWMQKVHS